MKKMNFSLLLPCIALLVSCKKNNHELSAPHIAYPTVAAVTGQWRQMLDTSNIDIIESVFFSIGDSGYTINQHTNAVYRYSATLNTVVRKKNFPGERRQSDATAFAIGSKGYYGLGVGQKSIKEGSQTEWQYQYFLDFWEYDPVTDNWTQRTAIPAPPNITGIPSFLGAYGFGIGNKGYVGSGRDANFSILPYFFEFDPAANSWTKRVSNSDIALYGPQSASIKIAFSIGNKGYVGDSTHLWEFTPSPYGWKAVAPAPVSLQLPVISLGGKTKGYIYGSLRSLNSFSPVLKNDFYEYVPGSNSWNKLAEFAGSARASCPAFMLNNKVYLGFGSNLKAAVLGDVWEYTP